MGYGKKHNNYNMCAIFGVILGMVIDVWVAYGFFNTNPQPM